jgi:hypothetical protein
VARLVEAWVNVSALPVDEIAIAGKWKDFGVTNRSYLLWMYRNRFEFLISHTALDFPRATSTMQATSGTWYHVAGAYDGSTIRLYVNDNLEASTDTAGTLAATGELFFVGRTDAGANASDYFTGIIDEVRIWSSARTQVDIKGTG